MKFVITFDKAARYRIPTEMRAEARQESRVIVFEVDEASPRCFRLRRSGLPSGRSMNGPKCDGASPRKLFQTVINLRPSSSRRIDRKKEVN